MSMSRLGCTYENQSSKFYRSDQDFQRQFFHIYESRLNQISDLLKHRISSKHGQYEAYLSYLCNF